MWIEGESYPENASKFFDPILVWVENFVKTGVPVELNLRLQYFNSSSSKFILDLIDILDNHHEEGGKVKVNWHYADDDEDILESGEEFAEDLSLNFNFIPY